MDKNEIFDLKLNIDLLLNGIDPQSNVPFGEDCILKSKHNYDTLKKVSLILEYLIKVGMVPSVDKRIKFDFYLTEKQVQAIEISQEPLSISKFIYNINKRVDTSNMKKLPATAVTKWLTFKGYLVTTTDESGMEFKVLTKKASELGLTCQKKINKYGNEYSVNLYPEKAQRFIIDNLNEIIKFHYGVFTIPIE